MRTQVLVGVLLLTLASLAEAQTTRPCVVTTGPGNAVSVVCGDTSTPTPPPVVAPVITAFNADPSALTLGATSTLRYTVTGTAPMLAIAGVCGGTLAACGATSQAVTPKATGDTLYTLTATNAAGKASRMVTVTVTAPVPSPVEPPPPTPPPPPPTRQVWGAVTSLELGECSAQQHDVFMADGGDGWFYRTWHPQRDPSGCVYGHEHGDDPALQTNQWVRQNFNGLMGYAARRDSTMPGEPNGHMEPHNGYKVHVANIGEMNDEGRVNQNATTSMPHMGTGGPNRFNVDRHSVQIADWHQNGIHHTKIDAMFSTGVGANPVVDNTISPKCPTRHAAPTKDGLVIGQCAPQDSSYEIWTMVLDVLRANGEVLLRKFVTPAVFDPITVHNPANVGETVYYWDARVKPFMRFQNDWSGFRGCAREGYSQVGYHYNGGDASEEYLMDVRTQRIVTTAGPYTTRLVVGRSNTGGNPPFSSNILQFKKRRDHCEFRAKLSLTN